VLLDALGGTGRKPVESSPAASRLTSSTNDRPGELAMPLPDSDGSVGHSFGLEFGGIAIKNVTQISGLKMEQDVIELEQNTPDGGYSIKKVSGRWKAGECTLTRGLTEDNSFEKWIKESHQATADQVGRPGVMTVFDSKGRPIKRYAIVNAWPRSLEIGALKAGDTTVLVELLVLAYDRLEVG
jgi:phage tail-like protein